MKNIVWIIATTVAGLTALCQNSQAAQEHAGFFINGNIGQSAVNKGVYDDNDTAYGVNAGYRWDLASNFALGAEGGYVDLGHWSAKSSPMPAVEFLTDAKLSGLSVGVNAHLNLTDNWTLSGRSGVFRADIQGDQLVAGLPVHTDGTSYGGYAGAGFGYDFSSHFSVGLNYDYYTAEKNGLKFDPRLVSVSAEARF